MRARVASVRPFGVFVSLAGGRQQALVHSSQVAEDVRFGRDDDDASRVHALEYFCPPGSEVWVKLAPPDERRGAPGKLAASMRAVDQASGSDLDPDGALFARSSRSGGDRAESDALPELWSVHRATVDSLRPFGAFVRLEGFRRSGLVHASQISDHLALGRDDTDEERVADIGAVLAVGEQVWVKVVEVGQDPERGGPPRIGCSIKLVAQRTGEDLDPTNLKYRPRGSGPQVWVYG